jgi:hypothetical protein
MSNGSKTSKYSGDFYRTFLKLGRDDRRSVALRILRNQKVLADLYDHFLIQEALREPGANVSWEACLQLNKHSAS